MLCETERYSEREPDLLTEAERYRLRDSDLLCDFVSDADNERERNIERD